MNDHVTPEQAKQAASMMKSGDPAARKLAARTLERWQFQSGQHKKKRRESERNEQPERELARAA